MLKKALGLFLAIVVVYLGIVLFMKDFEKFKFIVTSIGAIVGFYFAYKRYERDKEIEIIDKYAKEYDGIIIELSNSNINEIGVAYDKLLNIWYKEFYLYSKGYITEELWKEWSYWIGFKLEELFKNDTKFINVFSDRLRRYYNYGYINNHKWSVVFGGYYARIKKKIWLFEYLEEDFYVFILRKIKYLKDTNNNQLNKVIEEQLDKLGREELNRLNPNLHI